MRYRAFTDGLLAAGRGESLALVAAMAGYFDQSHAYRDFLRHTGMTPRAFQDTFDGIARLMGEPWPTDSSNHRASPRT